MGEVQSKKRVVQYLKEMFDELDSSGEGLITLDEFVQQTREESVAAYFNALKLDVSDAQKLFVLLDHDLSGTVDIDEFLEGCFRLQGEARTLDVMFMQYELRHVRDIVDELGSLQTDMSIRSCWRPAAAESS